MSYRCDHGYKDAEGCVVCNVAQVIADKDEEIERLKAIIAMFKTHGTDGCSECEAGRVSIFIANKKCIQCAPEEYDAGYPLRRYNERSTLPPRTTD